jgi:hypothetical protein
VAEEVHGRAIEVADRGRAVGPASWFRPVTRAAAVATPPIRPGEVRRHGVNSTSHLTTSEVLREHVGLTSSIGRRRPRPEERHEHRIGRPPELPERQSAR